MERDRAEDEIQKLLQQPMGDTASEVAWTLLQRYRTQALAAARVGTTREEREAGVRVVRAGFLEELRDTLPRIIERERQCDEAVQEAQERARRVYAERFEQEVAVTLDDPAFDRPMAERIARAEFYTFRRELAEEFAELVGYHRQRLRETIARLLEE